MKVKSAGKAQLESGQSVLELVIALAIIVLSISAGIAVFFGGQSLQIDTQLSNRAVYFARTLLEETRRQAKDNFAGLANSTTTETEGEYTTSLQVESIDAYTKKVTARVSWQTDPLRPQQVELVSVLTDWREVAPPPDPNDTGGGGISGDWQNPRTLGSVDLGPGNSATDLDVVNKIVYLSAEASAMSKPDFFVIDAGNGSSPFILSSLNTGPSLNAIDVSGNYAYAANREADAELQVIDVSNRLSPVVVAAYAAQGVSGSSRGETVFYAGGRVYLGLNNVNGPEFHIFDISSPSSPVELGAFEVGADVSDIYVSGTTAYLATSHNDRETLILDVSNPANITQLGFWDSEGTEDGKSVYAVGTKVYFGQKSRGDREFHILDASNPGAVQLLGKSETEGDVNDLLARDYLAFLGTSDSNREFQVWNVSNPASPALWSSFNFPQVATGIDYEDNLVYVSVRSNDALRIITSQ